MYGNDDVDISVTDGAPGFGWRGVLCLDPVCGKLLSPSRAAAVVQADALYYFCSDDCQVRFIAEWLHAASLEQDELSVDFDDEHGHVAHISGTAN